MCKFTLYFGCKCPLVSLVIFWSSSGPPTTAYHCLEMLFCSDHTWGFCMPFSFSPVRLCLFHCRGRFVITTETHVACEYLSPAVAPFLLTITLPLWTLNYAVCSLAAWFGFWICSLWGQKSQAILNTKINNESLVRVGRSRFRFLFRFWDGSVLFSRFFGSLRF